MKQGLFILFLMPAIIFAGSLEDIFYHPPHDAKPRGYWVWPHGNFDYSALRHELQAFKARGLGGVDIFDLGIADRKNVIPAGPEFMSPEQVDGIAFALQEAEKLGLKMGLIVSSSWNAGATWTSPEQALMQMVAWSDTLDGPVTYQRDLPFPAVPDSFSKSYGVFDLHVPRDETGRPEYYKDVATLAFPVNADGVVEDVAQVKILDGPDGVDIELPGGRWIILRTVCTNFGQQLWVPSKNSQGLVLDHFSGQAVRDHFLTIIERLRQRCGPLEKTSLERLYLASYESNPNIIWTPSLAEEFYQRNTYRIEPWLPALFGTTIQNKEMTGRFLYDFRKTVSDLFIENLYRNARDICHEHGLKICSEAGGPGAPLHDVPTEDLKALGAVDVMRGEFWTDKQDRFDPDGFLELQIVKGIAGAAHIYDHRIVEMEAFTSHVNWQEGPAFLKPFADRAFCEGMNRVVFHTMSHNLPEAGVPGWSFQAGTHINTNLTWWDMSAQFIDYLTRCSALLQQGRFVADVCFYYGHQIPKFVKPKHIRPGLGPGYDYDDINTEVLLTADVKDGRILLPGGMSYAVLALPDDDKMDLAVLKKVEQLLKAGAVVVGPKPSHIYGLAGFPQEETELKAIATELWGTKAKVDRAVGKGRLVYGNNVRSVLSDMGIGPDVRFTGITGAETMDYIHRRTADADIYFIRNAAGHAVNADVLFRVTNKQPQFWDAVTGRIKTCALYQVNDTSTRVRLSLPASGSLFVVFRGPLQPHISTVVHKNKTLFPAQKTCSGPAISAWPDQGGLGFYAGETGRYQLTTGDGAQKSVTIDSDLSQTIDGQWTVRFPHGWGAKTLQTFDSLNSWTESPDEGTRTFSGTATYKKNFNLSDGFIQNRRVFLDLGTVKETAHVYLNGHDLGITGFPPHRLDITDKVRSGENFLVVKVANTWLNRLIADDKKPESERLTHTNLREGPTLDKAWRLAEPKPSGLLGPVRVFARQSVNVNVE